MAVVTYQLQQVTSIQPGSLYRVNNSVLSAAGSSPAVFVYKTDGQKFSHYATVADLESWPDSYTEACTTSKEFYRLDTVQRDWATIELMNEDLRQTLARVQNLATQLAAVQGSVVINRTTTISGG